jgi:hypothetical protein
MYFEQALRAWYWYLGASSYRNGTATRFGILIKGLLSLRGEAYQMQYAQEG